MSPTRHDDFNELYRAHGGRLVVQLYALTQDLHLAEDLVQEAFCRALSRWSRISGYEDPVGWIRRVAWNLAATNWRQSRRARDLLHGPGTTARGEAWTPGPSIERVELVRALAGLPVPQRRAVIMYYLGDMPIAEVAQVEKASENTIKQRLHRARASLAALMHESQPEAGNA